MDNIVSRIRAFYKEYLPAGDRLGEIFYAIWMVVVSLGILGTTQLNKETVLYVVLVAFTVNLTWGLIDGITVMHGYVIEKARIDQTVFDLRSRNDQPTRKEALESLNRSVTVALSDAEKHKVLDMIAAGKRGEDPSRRRYYPDREDWKYAWGLCAIDVFLVVPLVIPLLIWNNTSQAIFASRLIATALFASLGAAYAQDLHRRKWLAALFLGTICFSLFSLAFLNGW